MHIGREEVETLVEGSDDAQWMDSAPSDEVMEHGKGEDDPALSK